MANEPDQHEAFAAVIDAVELVCGFPREELGPELLVAELNIDSLSASEIVQQVENSLDIEVDAHRIAGRWSSLTLASLAEQFVGHEHRVADGA